jgi:hypothetical protein
VDTRPNPQKTPTSNSPNKILFAKQRENPNFLQNIFLQLATLFSVCLRVFPFWKDSPKKYNPKIPIQSRSIDLISAISRRPIIKGLPTDLILSVTRLL